MLRILTLNSGSSSIKFSVYEVDGSERLALSGSVDAIGRPSCQFRVADAAGHSLADDRLDAADHHAALTRVFTWLREGAAKSLADHSLDAIGHRLAHGGLHHREPERITPGLLAELWQLTPLAPEHLPHELRAVEAATSAYPGVSQVACFDTAFHRHMPAVAQTYALPRSFAADGLIRFGFHGLSYEYIVSELTRAAGEGVARGRVIVAHLGNGSSMAAIHDGRSIDTTMGFTPTGGLVMSTRAGDLDPGVVLYLLESKGLTPTAVRRLVSHESGLLGVSGTSGDMHELLGRVGGDSRSAEAVALYCYQARKFLAGMAAALGGVDTLVFTAGIGENAPLVRQLMCAKLEFFGIRLDAARNEAGAPIISDDSSPATVRVMHTNEELMIARHTAALAHSTTPASGPGQPASH